VREKVTRKASELERESSCEGSCYLVVQYKLDIISVGLRPAALTKNWGFVKYLGDKWHDGPTGVERFVKGSGSGGKYGVVGISRGAVASATTVVVVEKEQGGGARSGHHENVIPATSVNIIPVAGVILYRHH
jgi:hypothetical protein